MHAAAGGGVADGEPPDHEPTEQAAQTAGQEGRPARGPRRGGRRAVGAIAGVLARLALLGLVVLAVVALLTPSTYRITQGEATVQVTPVLRRGHTVVPLGPIGSVQLRTHNTPIDLTVSFVFDDDLPLADQPQTVFADLPPVEATALDALRSFGLAKLPWVCVLGLAAGLLAGGVLRPFRWRGSLLAAGAGLLVVWLLAGVLVGVSYATFERRPAVTYTGLARYAPRVVGLVQELLQHPKAAEWSAEDLAHGLEEVARQSALTAPVAVDSPVTRVLVAGDTHDNIVGCRLLRRLAADPQLGITAVVLVGDLTHVGTAAEADLILSELRGIEVPISMVGGNHENAPAMRRFREAGLRILDGGLTLIGGLRVTGFSDPLAGSAEALTDPVLLTQAAENALASVQAELPPPQVLVVHDLGQAQPTIEWAKENEIELLVLHGHDHKPRVHREGSVVIVGAGTAGASGFEQLGRDPGTPYDFQLIEIDADPQPTPVAVVTLRYEGVNGTSSATYVPLVQSE